MVKFLIFLITYSIFYGQSAHGEAFIAKIIKLRGDVSLLEHGSLVARKVKVGDQLREDSSILTGNKSFARILFDDNTVMNVGPRSKVAVLETRPDGTSFIHLLKGTIRSKVHKVESSTKHKYYLKTRSAAMAVRGTDFQAVYNPLNNVSSLLTYEGEVVIAKVEEDPAEEVKRLKRIRRKQLAEQKVNSTASGEIEIEETRPKYDLEGRMDQALSNKEAVVVKRGQYSGTVNALKRASMPVKISPVQLNALYQNTEMEEKLRRSEVKEKSLNPGVENFQIAAAEQEAPAEGIYDPKAKKFAPRSGGVLDINSGLYVPPEKNSIFDAKNKVFVPTDASGRIDVETGQYVTPKGIKLDARKGFVARISSKQSDDANRILLAQAESLNDSTKPKLWAGGDTTRISAPLFNHWSETEKISKDIIELEVFGYSETFESKNETGGTSRKFESEDAKRLLIRWSHNSESKWQPITTFGFKTTEYSSLKRGSVGQPTRDGVMLGIGVRYNLTSRWNLIGELLIEQELYINQESSSLFLKRVAVPKAKIGFEGPLFTSGKFSFDTNIYILAALAKESGSHKVGNGFGYGVDLLPRWWINKKWTVYTGLGLQNQSQSVTNTGFTADNSHVKTGLKLGLGYLF